MSMKKNLMSHTEALLKEISGKLDKVIENQEKLITNTQKGITIPIEQAPQQQISMPQAITIKQEEKK